MTRILACLVLVGGALVWCGLSVSGAAQAGGAVPPVPLADHHQHLFSPAIAQLFADTPPVVKTRPRTAADLIAQLDAAGIQRAVVLSAAYIFEQPSRKVAGAHEKVSAENDWTSREVAKYPGRLIGFCGLNPLKDYAVTEIDRCAADRNLRSGLKLHFGNSAVDYRNPAHLGQLRAVFRAANDHRMAIVIHMRSSSTLGLPYGRAEALTFLNELLPAAPDVVVQVAHLAGGGPADEAGSLDALDVLADAVAQGDSRARLLYFDVSILGGPPAQVVTERWASAMRRIGLSRVLFGSDATLPNVTPADAWESVRTALPLTDAEVREIAGNVPPHLR